MKGYICCLVVGYCGIAFAGNIPEWSIDKYCKKVSETVGGSYQIEAGCQAMEKSAKNSLEGDDIEDRIANYCIRVSNTVGGSYQIMKGCVDNEVGAKNSIN